MKMTKKDLAEKFMNVIDKSPKSLKMEDIKWAMKEALRQAAIVYHDLRVSEKEKVDPYLVVIINNNGISVTQLDNDTGPAEFVRNWILNAETLPGTDWSAFAVFYTNGKWQGQHIQFRL